jgi:transposase
MTHRARYALIHQRIMLVNARRGHLAKFGLIEAQERVRDIAR